MKFLKTFAFFVFVSMILFFSDKALASNFSVNISTDCSMTGSVSLDKTSYNPSEPIIATATISSMTCIPPAIASGGVLVTGPTSDYPDWTNGQDLIDYLGTASTNFVAPSQGGNYSIWFKPVITSSYGDSNETVIAVGFSVGVNPGANVILASNKTFIAEGEQITLTWLSSNTGVIENTCYLRKNGVVIVQNGPKNGSQIDSPITTPTYYNITCNAESGGIVADDVTVTIGASAFLKLKTGAEKPIVKANNSENIGRVYFEAVTSNIPSNKICQLKNTTTGAVWSMEKNRTVILEANMLAPGVNNFQVRCFDPDVPANISPLSNMVSVNGQSGNLTQSVPSATCVINVNSSSCNLPMSWSTNSPKDPYNTFLGGVPTTTTTTGDYVSTTFSGNNIPNGTNSTVVNFISRNTVYGETTNSPAVVNQIATLPVAVSCASGSSWNSSLSKCVLSLVPSVTLTAIPTSGFVGMINPRLTWTTTNNPTSCTASGDWGGSKNINGGFEDMGILNTVKTYTYNLICTNSAGNSNIATASVVVTASTVNRPDLIASGITPTTAVAGIARTFTSTITNQGNADTDYEGVNTFTNLFQTATGFDDPTSQLGPLGLNSYAVTGMGILDSNGGSSNTNRSITFPTAGTYYIRVCADKNSPANTGLINESNENNNCSHPWTAITVTSSARPDLTAGETTPSSTVVNVGRTYTASIRNQGTASTGIGFQNSFQTATGFDDPILFLGPENLQNYNASSSMSALGVGASATATSPTITFSNTGNYYMRACADIPPANPGTVTNESNENNNCGPWSIVSVGISATVDLRASAPTQNTATIGVPMNFTSMISNQGNTVTENSFYNTFQVATEANGGGMLTRINSTPSPMPALAPGGLATATSVSHTFTGLPTTRSVRACADMNSLGVGRINETNETNNCSAWTNVTFPGSNTTGTISATNCTIASGASTCRTTLNWNTVNPVSGGISAVTTSPDNTIVRTGLSGTNYDYEISQGNHPFYLYHSLPVSTLLAETVANATCVLGTAWIDGKCTPSTVSGNLTIIPNSCIIQSGESTCTVKGATWTTNNAIKPALIDVNTGSILSNLANNSEPLEVWVSYPQTVFNLTHDGTPSILDTEKVEATCVLGTAWIDGKCTPSTTMTGSLSASPNPCIIASGSSTCNTTLSWAINNTEAIPSEITANGMAPLSLSTPTIGGNYSGTRTAVVTHPSRTFFLYNNGKSLVPADGSGVEVRANCASGTVWDGSKCSPSGGVGIDGMCGFPHNDCDAGTSFDLPDSVDTYMWRCLGESGGEDSGICTEDISGGGGGVIDITFEAKPKRILKGRSSTLTWTSNAEKCLGSTIPEGGEFDTGGNFEGSLLVKPNSTTTYVLTCSRGENSAVAEAEVKVSVIKFFEI